MQWQTVARVLWLQESLGTITIGASYLPTSEKLYLTIESMRDLKVVDKATGSTGKLLWQCSIAKLFLIMALCKKKEYCAEHTVTYTRLQSGLHTFMYISN